MTLFFKKWHLVTVEGIRSDEKAQQFVFTFLFITHIRDERRVQKLNVLVKQIILSFFIKILTVLKALDKGKQ